MGEAQGSSLLCTGPSSSSTLPASSSNPFLCRHESLHLPKPTESQRRGWVVSLHHPHFSQGF